MTDTPPDFRVSDGIGPLTVDGNVNVADGGGSLTVDDGGGSLTVDAVALPLPTGAATSALQTPANSSLASLDSKLNTLGQKISSVSLPVVLSSDQSTIPVSVVSSVEVEVKNDSGNPIPTSVSSLPLPLGASTAALQSAGNSSLASIDAKTASVGQKTSVASSPVVLASDQSTIPVSSASLPLPSGASTAALQTSGNASLVSIDAGIPAALGQTIMSASMPVTLASDHTPIQCAPADGTKATYSAAVGGFICALAPTDIFTIQGSATKIIRITRISISGTTTAGSGISINFSIIKRLTANTGGTSAIPSVVSHDSQSAVGTAIVRNYTANPSALGTSIGSLRSCRLTISTSGSVSSFSEWTFGDRPSQSVILRGTNEFICLNFGGSTITGPLISATVEWTEES